MGTNFSDFNYNKRNKFHYKDILIYQAVCVFISMLYLFTCINRIFYFLCVILNIFGNRANLINNI